MSCYFVRVKAAADGALIWFLQHSVTARAARYAFGQEIIVKFNPNNAEHVRRGSHPRPDGDFVWNGWDEVVPRVSTTCGVFHLTESHPPLRVYYSKMGKNTRNHTIKRIPSKTPFFQISKLLFTPPTKLRTRRARSGFITPKVSNYLARPPCTQSSPHFQGNSLKASKQYAQSKPIFRTCRASCPRGPDQGVPIGILTSRSRLRLVQRHWTHVFCGKRG